MYKVSRRIDIDLHHPLPLFISEIGQPLAKGYSGIQNHTVNSVYLSLDILHKSTHAILVRLVGAACLDILHTLVQVMYRMVATT